MLNRRDMDRGDGPRLAAASVILKVIPWRRKVWVWLSSAAAFFFILTGGNYVKEALTWYSKPCELTGVMATGGGADGTNAAGSGMAAQEGSEGMMSERDVLRASSAIEGVDGISLFWSIPGMLSYGEYHADVTVYGISSDYLDGKWLQGTAFSPDAAMPQCVLNTAVLSSFQDDNGHNMPDASASDWLSADLVLINEKPLDLRVAGVLDTSGIQAARSQTAEVYMDAARVRAIMADTKADGQAASGSQVRIRFSSRMALEKCRRRLARLGIIIDSAEEGEQQIAELLDKGRTFLISGATCLILAVVLMCFLEKLYITEEKQALEYLVSSRTVRRVMLRQSLMRLAAVLAEGMAMALLTWYLVGQ